MSFKNLIKERILKPRVVFLYYLTINTYVDLSHLVKSVSNLVYDLKSVLVGNCDITLINSINRNEAGSEMVAIPDDFFNLKAIGKKGKIILEVENMSGTTANKTLFIGKCWEINFSENEIKLSFKDILYELLEKEIGTEALIAHNIIAEEAG